ncbi:MAG: tetratricopeptide repeat protein [PVC group bacterium]|nr:tetratricopeptide repeat protein [PVC group bacterium]
MRRKTLTILFADVQGYTMRTARQTREQNEQFINEIRSFIKSHTEKAGVNFVKSLGDGFLLTFESPTDAVVCGQEIQAQIKQRNSNLTDRFNAIRFRIGISTGEVNIDDNGDVYGNAVNIAARIQAFASPSDVFISESTYLAMNRSEVNVMDLGPQKFKNVLHDVRVYRVLHGRPDMDDFSSEMSEKKSSLPTIFFTFIIILLVALVLLFIFHEPTQQLFRNKQTQNTSEEITQLMNEGNYRAAIDLAKKSLEENPAEVHLYAAIGEAYLKLRNYAKAEDYLQEAIDLNSKDAMPFFNIALVFEETARYNDALLTLGIYINKEANEFKKKKALQMMHDIENKKVATRAAEEHKEKDRLERENRERALQERERELRAREQLEREERARTIEEKELDLERQQLKIEFQQQKQSIQQQSSQKFADQEAQLNQLVRDGDFDEVTELGEKMLKKDPHNIKLRGIVSDAYLKVRDYYRAKQHMQQAINKRPGRANLYAKMAVIHEKAAEYEEAIDMLNEYIARETSGYKIEQAVKMINRLKEKL